MDKSRVTQFFFTQKSRPPWPVMMDDNAPTHERRKLVKTYKTCSLENGLWLLKYAGRPSPKYVIKWTRKTGKDVINPAK